MSEILLLKATKWRSSRPDVFLVKGVLKICNKFTGEHPCGIVTSIILFCIIKAENKESHSLQVSAAKLLED